MNQLESELNELESLLQSSAKDEANSGADKENQSTEVPSPMQVGNKESINCDKNEPTEEDEHEEDELKKNLIQSLLIELVMNVSLEFEQKAPSKGNIIRSKAELKHNIPNFFAFFERLALVVDAHCEKDVP